ncbi:uncharacterized protein LOC143629932 [Bidens hawaiensis]|uniref:uncharacterized protein LOC143629932 n=1 Tax=Bidens hawaiensis TaxID=980011 RepID=UPI004049A529
MSKIAGVTEMVVGLSDEDGTINMDAVNEENTLEDAAEFNAVDILAENNILKSEVLRESLAGEKGAGKDAFCMLSFSHGLTQEDGHEGRNAMDKEETDSTVQTTDGAGVARKWGIFWPIW